jgi:hypothetical protein
METSSQEAAYASFVALARDLRSKQQLVYKKADGSPVVIAPKVHCEDWIAYSQLKQDNQVFNESLTKLWHACGCPSEWNEELP